MSSNLQEEIKNFVKDIEEKLVSFRRSMHQNPELSSEEYNTSEKIFKFLEKRD